MPASRREKAFQRRQRTNEESDTGDSNQGIGIAVNGFPGANGMESGGKFKLHVDDGATGDLVMMSGRNQISWWVDWLARPLAGWLAGRQAGWSSTHTARRARDDKFG